MTGEIGSALEDISMKVFNLNSTGERKATGVGGEQTLRELWENIKKSNIHAVGSPRRKGARGWKRKSI